MHTVVDLTMIDVTSNRLVQLEFIDTAGYRHIKTYDGQTFVTALEYLASPNLMRTQITLRTLGILTEAIDAPWTARLDDDTVADMQHGGNNSPMVHLLKLLKIYGQSIVAALQVGQEQTFINPFLGVR